jgi:molecular chaperone GrpE
MSARSHHAPDDLSEGGAGHDPQADLSPTVPPRPTGTAGAQPPGSAGGTADPGPGPGDTPGGDATPEDPTTPDPAAEASRWKDLALRTAADLDNFRKRTARERSESLRFANASLLDELLPVIDNFEWGLQAASSDAGSPIYQGMAMVQKQLQDFLTSQGVETIDATGQEFDPNLHEAVSQEPHDDIPENRVICQTRKGYRLHGRLLRPASVTVSRGPAAPGGQRQG